MDRHLKVIGALPEDGRASTAPTLASLGINEQPLYGHVVPEEEGIDTRNPPAQSGYQQPVGGPKPCMRYGGHGRLRRQVGGNYQNCDPCAATTSSCFTGVRATTGSCLDERVHPVQETSPQAAARDDQRTPRDTLGAQVRRCSSRGCEGDCLVLGLHPVKETTLAHVSVSGSSLKPSHEEGRARSAEPYTDGRPHVVSRCSEKPKTPVRRGAVLCSDNAALPCSSRPQAPKSPCGASTRGGGDIPARSALRNQHRLCYKSAWEDVGEDEPLDLQTAEAWSRWKGRLSVGFVEKTTIHYVTAYAEVYGQHPRTFHFAHDGTKIPISSPWPGLSKRATRSTTSARERSLSLCEMQPPFADYSHRRSMNTPCIDQARRELVISGSSRPSCIDMAWRRGAPRHEDSCVLSRANSAQAVPILRRDDYQDIAQSSRKRTLKTTARGASIVCIFYKPHKSGSGAGIW